MAGCLINRGLMKFILENVVIFEKIIWKKQENSLKKRPWLKYGQMLFYKLHLCPGFTTAERNFEVHLKRKKNNKISKRRIEI